MESLQEIYNGVTTQPLTLLIPVLRARSVRAFVLFAPAPSANSSTATGPAAAATTATAAIPLLADGIAWLRKINKLRKACPDSFIPGTTLRTPDGTQAHITATHHYDKRQRTHNLTIEGIHTYHVMAGDTPVLVHNAGCDEFADQLQQEIGGEIWTLTPKAPFPALGDYKLAKESWGHHTVVVKDGRVYDQFTGKDGMPMDEWKAQWLYPDDHDWTRKR